MDIMEQIKTNFIKVAENTTKVYNAGFEAGKKVGGGGELDYDEIYQSGQDAGYNIGKTESIQSWINGITDNGKRTNYQYAFSYFNLDIFKDKSIEIEIKPGAATGTYMFRGAKWSGEECFPPSNFRLDLSKCTTIAYLFQNAEIEHIGELNLSKVTTITSAFAGCSQLKKIDKIIFSDTKSPAIVSGVFSRTTGLEEIRIEGSITNTFYIAQSAGLSRDSILSILKALKISGVSPVITLPSACQSLVTGDTADAELNEEYIRATTELTYDIQFA